MKTCNSRLNNREWIETVEELEYIFELMRNSRLNNREWIETANFA